MTWAISVPISVFLSVSVLHLGPMYATDRQTSDAHHRLMPPTLGAGHNNIVSSGRVTIIDNCNCVIDQTRFTHFYLLDDNLPGLPTIKRFAANSLSLLGQETCLKTSMYNALLSLRKKVIFMLSYNFCHFYCRLIAFFAIIVSIS